MTISGEASSERAEKSDREFQMEFLSNQGSKNIGNDYESYYEELKTTPLFSGDVLDSTDPEVKKAQSVPELFPQYGLLAGRVRSYSTENNSRIGENAGDTDTRVEKEDDPRIFLNVNPPWSAFICGSQGSGKSHTLSCMLENCLLESKLGKLPNPLAALVFHYDRFTSCTSNQACEAAYLCSRGVPVRVLVSRTNLSQMEKVYSNLPGLPDDAGRPKVIPLLFQEKHLNVERMKTLMAVNGKDGPVPLYIESIQKILREMAIESPGTPGLDYSAFKRKLDSQGFSRDQNGPLKLRLDLLESFMDQPTKARTISKGAAQDAWSFQKGSLTIVDLSCPFVDDSAACALFTICLALFLEDRGDVGRVVVLDEAHKFMTGTDSASAFTEELLQVIRQQRHLATRVIIATQEPTISPKLLDLSTFTIVHRFTSPEWLRSLQSHLAGLSLLGDESTRDIQEIFKIIVTLEAGQALLFSPTAMLEVNEKAIKLGMQYVKMRVRKRHTADGGRSIMAV